MDIKIFKPGDKVLVECTVQAVFANGKMVMVTTRDCTEGFDAYIDEIQEPKTGHWMKSNIGGAKVCSVCNAHMGLSSFKFCPNCGAKMVEPQESEVEDGKID